MRAAPIVFVVSVMIASSACGSSSAASSDDATTSDDATETDGDARGPMPDADVFDASDPFDASTEGPWFHERAVASGVDFVRTAAEFDSFAGRMAGGVCAFDANDDGRIDLFFPQGEGAPSRLYLAHGAWSYVDEAAAWGLDAVDAGGCMATDLDGDGALDLLTLGNGTLRLFRDDGARFVEASSRLAAIAIDPTVLYTSAVAFDADADGDLDLAVGAYGRYTPPPDPSTCVLRCDVDNGNFRGGSAMLLLQDDAGAFHDASDRILNADARTLVLLATDLDADHHVDLFVGIDSPKANDRYFRGDGAGGFADVALALGVAYDARKNGISSMSAMDGDVDGDGNLDLVESSWDDDPDSIFTCTGVGASAKCTEIGESLGTFFGPRNLRWGQALADFDDDAVTDLFDAVGQAYSSDDLLDPDAATFGPIEATQVFFRRTSLAPDAELALTDDASLSDVTSGRGAIALDLDGDGDLDVVVATAHGRPLLYENVRAPRGHALTIALKGRGKNARAIGAEVRVTVGPRVFPAMAHAGFGYRSSVDAPLHVGIGPTRAADAIDVTWPSGKTTHLDVPIVDALTTITEPP